VFNRGDSGGASALPLRYVGQVGDLSTAVEMDIFVAANGDVNGDGNVAGSDLVIARGNLNPDVPNPDLSWPDGDVTTAVGDLHNRMPDGYIAGTDIVEIRSSIPMKAAAPDVLAAQQQEYGQAIAEYDPGTGEFWITVTGNYVDLPGQPGTKTPKPVVSWLILGNNQDVFDTTSPDFAALPDILPIDKGFATLGWQPAIRTTNAGEVSEVSFAGDPLRTSDNEVFPGFIVEGYYQDEFNEPIRFPLGAIAFPGLTVDDFVLRVEYPEGEVHQGFDVIVIPEPGTVLMLLSGLAGLALVWWRRRLA
jgi:hypothetical protein